MNKYSYKKKTCFFLWDDCKVIDFSNEITEYFKNKYKITIECKGIDKEFINIKFITDDNYVIMKFKYDESLFYNCYKTDGVYECEKYIGTRPIINKLMAYLFDEYLLITKKEKLLCHKCGKITGIIFNDFEADEKSICAGGGECDDDKRLYSYYENGINKCNICGKYFCEDCFNDRTEICDECNESEFNEYKEKECDNNCESCIYNNNCNYEENLLNSKYVDCKLDEDDEDYEHCDECEYRNDCLEEIEDAILGEACFEEMASDAYGSVDAFWECNGI